MCDSVMTLTKLNCLARIEVAEAGYNLKRLGCIKEKVSDRILVNKNDAYVCQ